MSVPTQIVPFAAGTYAVTTTSAERTGAGITYGPDSPPCPFFPGDGTVHWFFADGGNNVVSGQPNGVGAGYACRTIGTLADPFSGGSSAFHRTPDITGFPSSTYNYRSVCSVLPAPLSDGSLFGVGHYEIWPGGNSGRYWSDIHAHRSTDGGLTWTWLGQIVTTSVPYNASATTNCEVGPGVLLVLGGYVYCYHNDDRRIVGGQLSLAAARTPFASLQSAALTGTTSAWTKYYQGSWGSPGVGGSSDRLQPAGDSTIAGVGRISIDAAGLMWAAMGDNASKWVYQSADGLHFFGPTTVFPADGNVNTYHGCYPDGAGGIQSRFESGTGSVWNGTVIKSAPLPRRSPIYRDARRRNPR